MVIRLQSQAIARVVLFSLLVVSLLSVSVVSQDAGAATQDLKEPNSDEPSYTSPEGMVFEEIELSPEGVVAYDSLSNGWRYDFERDLFEKDQGGTGAETTTDEDRPDSEDIEPVEQRCNIEKVVERSSRKAVFVDYDEYVNGDIIAVARVTVKGWVKGDVQSINKRVLVTASGRVDGNIRAPRIEVKGEVLGAKIITEPYSLPVDVITTSFSAGGVWVVFGFTLALLLVAFLASSLAPRQTETIMQCIRDYQLKSFSLGFLSIFMLPFLVALLAITIVGIVAIPLIPLAFLVALTVGMGSVCQTVVKLVKGEHPIYGRNLILRILTGVVFYMALWAVVAFLLGSVNRVLNGVGVAALVIAITLTLWPLLTGLGSVVLTRFGFRHYTSAQGRAPEGSEAAPPPAPPPIPQDFNRPPFDPGPPPPPPAPKE